MFRRTVLILALLLTAAVAAAEPARYHLDPKASSVQFTYELSGEPATGRMPITEADLMLDFSRVSRSTAEVTLDADGARTNLLFVTQALKSEDVLNTSKFPDIHFESTKVTGHTTGARLTGNVTIRGVTRPLVLDATISRPAGSARDDYSRLTMRLTGTLDRREFGADGFAELVSPRVGLNITAALIRQN